MARFKPIKKRCRFCGQVFLAVAETDCCCDDCLALAAPYFEQGLTLKDLYWRKCIVCGAIFPGKKRATRRVVCDICRLDSPKRRCHDCGAPTNGYRCPRCLSNWRLKHGVSAEPSGKDTDMDFYI